MVGSSMQISRGRPISARAIATICCSPPESTPGALIDPLGDAGKSVSIRSRSSATALRSAADRRPSADSRARVISGKMRAPRARSRFRRGSPDGSGSPSIRAPSNVTVPERGASSPRMIFIVVDLPLALPPSSETMRPSPTSSERSKCDLHRAVERVDAVEAEKRLAHGATASAETASRAPTPLWPR